MRERGLSRKLLAALANTGELMVGTEAAWQGFAVACGIHAANWAAYDPLRIATESLPGLLRQPAPP